VCAIAFDLSCAVQVDGSGGSVDGEPSRPACFIDSMEAGRNRNVRESFGTKNLGALTGLITMVHQIFGGVGAYAGAAIFDATGTYDAAFVLMLGSAVVALVLTLMLGKPASRASHPSPG
jgi:nitrate/nitrite transporter NarK